MLKTCIELILMDLVRHLFDNRLKTLSVCKTGFKKLPF